MSTLSKSKYTLSCQCLKALWLRCNKPEEAVVDAALEARFAAGSQIGKMARSLFGDYTDTTAYTNDGQLDISAMIRTTQQLMQSGCNVICEAAFSTPSHYCAVDILRKTSKGWAIYEVKSSTSHMIEEKPEKAFGKYAADIAYQRWVLEQCGVNVTETYLVTVNSDYVYMGQLDIQQFFNIVPMDAVASNEYLKVPNQVTRALQTMSENQEPKIDLSAKCNKPYKCAFWGYCTQHLPKHSVFNLYGVGCNFNQQLKLYKQGIISFEDLAQQSLGPIQTLQVNSWLHQQECINPAGIVKFLNKVRYPLYFLDFESMQPAVPIYPNSKPYMQICFQYSLHYIEHEGGELKHTAFLAESNGQDPRRELAESLCRDIPRNACIMAYNDPFEKTRIKEMASIFPDLADHLMNIHSHIIDLLIPFREGNYYRPNMGGSFSIKVVLPSLFPNDPELDYHHLSELVQNGGDAMTIFPKMKDMHPDEEQKARQALLEYCKLDTYAMVKIWRKMLEKCMNDPIETLRQKIDKHAFKKHLDAIQKTPTMMDILGVARDENSHSDVLAWLFDSNNDHGLGTKVVENLLSILDLNLNDNLKVSESKSSRECCIDNGRVDIIVELETNDQGKYRIVFENKIHAKETKGDQTQRYYDHYNNLKDNIQNIFVFNRYDIGQKPRCEKFKCITYQDIAEKVIKPIIDKKDANKLTKKILEDYLLTLEKPINNHILAMRTETKEKLRNFTTEILPILDIAVKALVQNTNDDDNSQLYKDLAKAVATLKNKSNYEVKLQLQSAEKQYTSLAEAAVFLVQTLADQFMDNSNISTKTLQEFESYIGKADFFGNSTFLIPDGHKCSGTFPKKYSITLGGNTYKICTDWYTEETKKTKQFQKFLDVVLNKIGGVTKVVVTQNGNQIYPR